MLSVLKKKEPVPVIKAAVILCRTIFTGATDIPEFQRQVSTPNVPKFTAALISLLEKEPDVESKVLVLETLFHLVPLYPNIHRASHAALTSIVTRILMDSSSTYTGQCLVKSASKLYSVLHYTGGKVGAANMWRKAVDDTLFEAWNAFHGLRTTFPDEHGRIPGPSSQTDPAVFIATGLERLRSFVLALCSLLKSASQRPVNMPVGSIVRLAIALVTVTKVEQTEVSVDSNVHIMENLVVPSIWRIACGLIVCLTKCIGHHMTPYLGRLSSYIVYHLEQKPSCAQRLPFLEALQTLLTHCHPLHDSILSTRLTKIVLPLITIVLASQANASNEKGAEASRGKKGKRKARTYEGDEVFNTFMEVICPAADDGKALLAACDVLQLLLRNSDVTAAVHSIASRVVLSALFYLPQTTPSLISPDLQVYERLNTKIQNIARELGAGSTTAMSKSLCMVVRALSMTGLDDISSHELDILLHPRLPPLLRPLPAVETLALFRSEESNEEAQAREALGLEISSINPIVVLSAKEKDVAMADPASIVHEQLTSAHPADTQSAVPVTTRSPISTQTEPVRKQDLTQASNVVPITTVSMRSATESSSSSIPTAAPVASSSQPMTVKHTSKQVDVLTMENAGVNGDEEIPSIDMDSDSDFE
ncbi:hypothetical protein VKT23_001856 [Stygiomarasmius scandens]|uniref:Pre-rRNA-processing protein RIX1 n=1 Tax=Marasmiellus scandens TaxID=2682957 RepID=A0ABR1K065_9AGAR